MSAIAAFEQLLDRDPRWALSQGSQFFEGKGAVQEALLKITGRLNELGACLVIRVPAILANDQSVQAWSNWPQ
jgi:hypothetical protein